MTLNQYPHDSNNPLFQSLESLFKKTRKKHWKKKTFATDLAGLQIPGFTAELAHLLSLEIQNHLKDNNNKRTKDHLIELIEERLFDWGIISTSFKTKKETPKPDTLNNLTPDLLEKLRLIRHQEKIEDLIATPNQTTDKIHFENDTRGHWQKLLQLGFDESVEMKLKRVARELALSERIYSPNCFLPEWQTRFFEILCHPAIIVSPYLLNNQNRPEFMSEQITLPPPHTTEEGFETLKKLTGFMQSKIPLGIDLGELPPSSDFFDSPTLSGEVIPFIQTLLNSSLTHDTQPLLRLSLNINHPDIMTFLDLIPRMVLQNIKPTILLDSFFLESLFKHREWTPFFQNRKGHSLTINDVTQKLLRCLIDFASPDILSLPTKISAAGKQTPAYFGGILTHPHSNYLTVHLNISDFGLNLSNYWDEIRVLLEQSCHLLDNAMMTMSPTHSRHYVFNLYGLTEWLAHQGIEVTSRKASDQMTRLFVFMDTELTKIGKTMGQKRGHPHQSTQRFHFSLTSYQHQLVENIFGVNAGFPSALTQTPIHCEGPLEIKYKGISNPREILKIFKLLSPSSPFLLSFAK